MMSEPQDTTEAAGGRSDSTAELATPRDIVDRLRDSQPEGTAGGLLLNDAADEIERLRDALAGMTAAADSLHQDVFDLTRGG